MGSLLNNDPSIQLFVWSAVLYVGVACFNILPLLLPEQIAVLAAVVLKCLPMVILINFVRTERQKVPSDSGLILLALFASVVGDAALVYVYAYPIAFLVGLVMFLLAHIFYIVSMGFGRFGPKAFFVCTLQFILLYSYSYQHKLGQESLLMRISSAFYGLALFGMQWRAWVDVKTFGLTGGDRRASIVAMGATLFIISDTTLIVNKFCYPVPFSGFLIMTTYYAAQCCFALSVHKGGKTQ